MKIRIKFKKYGVMRFIGHLDIMRYFQKAMRRADIDIAYSEGFSPHQIMSFAAPLGVGIISDGEYLDIEVHSTKSSKESIDALNAVMVDGMEITEYVALPDDAKKSMTIVAGAEYNVYYKDPSTAVIEKDMLAKAIAAYFSQKELLITKQTKKSERVIDIKPHIYTFEPYENEETFGFHLLLSAGSEENIKPELVLEDFCKYYEKEYKPFDYQIHRLDVYAYEKGEFVPLNYYGKEIV